MTSFTNTTTNYPQESNTPIRRVKQNHAPTSTQIKNFILGDEWLDTSTGNWWKLTNNPSGGGLGWFLMGGGSGAGTVTSVSGGNNITITGTPTVNPIVNVSGTTNHSLQVGNSSGSLTSLGVATNGQIPIGSTGANPVLATISSTDGSVSITNAAGSINLAVAGGSTTCKTLTGNSGGAVSPTSGNINTVGTGSITVVGNPGTSTLTTELTGLTNHNVLVGQGTTTIGLVAPVSSGYVLTDNGAGATPSFQALPVMGVTFGGDSGFGTPFTSNLVVIQSDNSANSCGSSVAFNAGSPNITLKVTDSNFNTFMGQLSGSLTVTGQGNCGYGGESLHSISTGVNNTALGYQSLSQGNPYNTVSVGNGAGLFCSGNFNSILGNNAFNNSVNGDYNLVSGYRAATAYNNNSESSNILLMNSGVLGESNAMRLGTHGSGSGQVSKAFVSGITGNTATSSAVVVGLDTSTQQLLETTVTAGTGITITPSSGAITISSTVVGLTWTTVSGTSQALAVSNGYVMNNPALVTGTLPATASVGDEIQICGLGSGGWSIAQNAAQLIHLGSSVTTAGTGGSISSTNQFDNIILRCIVANTVWTVQSAVGNLTVV